MNSRAEVVAHIPRLRRYAQALVRDPDRAEDLVQETLARALSRFGLWRSSGSLRGWLFTIMHNLFITDCRAAARCPETLPLGACASEPADIVRAESDAGVDEIERALAELPPQQRATLLLVSLEGLSYAETACVLGVKTGTVMSRLHRAREHLRALLDDSPTRAVDPGVDNVRRIR